MATNTTAPTGTKQNKKPGWVQSVVQLVVIPITLIVVTSLFSLFQLGISNHAIDQQHSIDTQLAQDQQHEAVLVDYEKDISDLLLNQHLGKSNRGDAIQLVAQAKTLATLNALNGDGKRKGLIIQFLSQAQLI